MKKLAILLGALACGLLLTAGSTFKFGFTPKSPDTGLRMSNPESCLATEIAGSSRISSWSGALDLTDLINLTWFTWDESVWSQHSAGFTDVDAHGLTALTILYLASVWPGGPTSMTNLNISGCTELVTLYIDEASALRSLDCSSMKAGCYIWVGNGIDLYTIILPPQPSEVTIYNEALDSFPGVSGCTNLTTVYLQNNYLPEGEVDGVLCDLDLTGVSGGTVNVSMNTAPSGIGYTCGSNLMAKGWWVTTD